MKKGAEEELLRILRGSEDPMTTRQILEEIREKCPDASVAILNIMAERGVIMNEWAAGKGFVWKLLDET